MPSYVPDSYFVLAEGGPVVGHGSVELEEAPIQENEEANGREALRPREHDLQRVPIPRPAGRAIS